MSRWWIVLVGIVLLAAHALVYVGYVVDDAWISFRYADNLAHGHGLVFQAGEHVEGYTNFLWVLLAAPFAALGIPLQLAMPALGLVCAAALIAIAVRRAGDGSRFAGLPTALLLPIAYGIPFHAVAGLETMLFALLLLIAELMLVDRRPVPFAIATTLAFFTRPEAALLGIIGTSVLARHDRKAGLHAIGVFMLLVGPYLAFKLHTFGALLPNTIHAKPPDLASGLRYGLLELGPFVGLVIAAVVRARSDVRARELTILALTFVLAAVIEGGDWMPGGRMIVPHLAPLAIAADPVLRSWARPGSWTRVLAAASVIVLVGIQIDRAIELRRGVEARAPIDRARAELARHLERDGVRSAALLDIGLFAYRAPSIAIVDLGGLVDETIARAPGDHTEKRAPFEYLEHRAPDVVILTSAHAAIDGRVRARFACERHLETSSWLREHYTYEETWMGAAEYRMHVFRRR